ncbi:MAG: MgtC/SapB family protein [Oscillospiraceae bacterium]|nr:MgtC/SapB family protein [Oscillospiraceae bacterium]
MLDFKIILLRILLAALAGGAIGLNREKISQAAGLRTYMAVTSAAALTAMLGIWLKFNVGDTDVARLPAAFISGLGFLGVGAIWKEGDNTVKGLTTAAGLLASSVTGIAVGAGFYYGALINFIVTFLVIVFLDGSAKKIERTREISWLYCELKQREGLKDLLSCIDSCGGRIVDLKTEYLGGADGHVAVTLLVRESGGASLSEILSKIRDLEKVTFALYL